MILGVAWDSFIVLCSSCFGCSGSEDAAYVRLSEALSQNCVDMVGTTTMLKSVYQEVDVMRVREPVNHTHGRSAADRSTASRLIDRISTYAGLEVSYYQGSSADERAGREATRFYLWAKDQMATPRLSRELDAIAMVDVDYYIDDLPARMATVFRPYLFYTFVPSRAAKDVGEYKYCFEQDGTVSYYVSGGGAYRHQVWNWDGDSMAVEWKFMGIPWKRATYALERRQMDADHQVILAAPLRQANGPVWVWLSRWLLKARPMTRMDPRVGEFVRLRVNEPDALMVSTGKVGGFSCAKTTAAIDDSIVATFNTSKAKPTLSAIKSKMVDNKPDALGRTRGAEVLLEFHQQSRGVFTHVSIVNAVRSFQWIPRGCAFDEDAKPSMVAFMAPLVHGGFAPAKSYNNDLRAVEKRVKAVADKEIREISNFVSDCMDEFLERLIPYPRCLEPYEPEVVYERQSKPSQLRILETAEIEMANYKSAQFMKSEAYMNLNDPRLISTINGVDKREYSAYIYMFVDEVLKLMPWYAFGRAPAELARDLAENVLFSAAFALLSDFSRMDGRVNCAPRELEVRMMMRAFARKWHLHLHGLMRKQHHLSARTSMGVQHETAYERLSGSAETSAFNTVLNAFIFYLAARMSFRPGTGVQLSADEAWEHLLHKVRVAGDDGVAADGITPDALKRSASTMGQVLTFDIVKRGQPGVKFLARRYGPDVWTGEADSTCDLPRQLSKFHLTTNLPSNITRTRKLVEKSFAFWLTDKNTPIIGEFVRKVFHLFPYRPAEFENVLNIYGVEMDADRQYPNEYHDWMEDIPRLELEGFDVDMFRDWLRRADRDTIFSPPLFAEPVPATGKPGIVSVDGDTLVIPDDSKRNGRRSKPAARKADGKPHFRSRRSNQWRDSTPSKTSSSS